MGDSGILYRDVHLSVEDWNRMQELARDVELSEYTVTVVLKSGTTEIYSIVATSGVAALREASSWFQRGEIERMVFRKEEGKEEGK